MKDVEFSAMKADQGHSLGHDPREGFVVRRNFTPKQVLTYISIAIVMVGAIFGIGLVASVCERSYKERDGLHSDQDAVSQLSEAGQPLAARAVQIPGVLRAKDMIPDAEMTATFDEEEGVKIPISTQTELSTLYSFSRIVLPTSETSSGSEETECTPSVVTETHTAVVTVTVSPLPSSSGSGFVTVTGEPSTVTEDKTYLTGPTVITVSGEPSTVTDVQTDTSFTSGLPDVTVSGSPSTVTDIQTSTSVTEGPSDVTVTGIPGTVTETDVSYSLTSSGSVVTVIITDLWDPEPTTTITTVATSKVTLTTVESSPVETVTDYLPPPEESSSVVWVSSAKGEGQTRSNSITTTVIIDPPFPTNGTSTYPAGTVTNIPGPTTPAVVSGGSKKPEPHGWTTNGTGQLTCTVMLVAIIMCLL